MRTRLDVDLRDEILLTDFRELVKENNKKKFKKYYAVEVSNAIKFYMAAYDFKDYRNIIEGQSPFNLLGSIPHLHAHSKPVFDQKNVYFVTKFFKVFYDLDIVKPETITRFIKKTLVISDPRAVKNWKIFLKDIEWVDPHATGWEILLTEKSLYNLLGEDPTGIYDPYRNDVLRAFGGEPIKNEKSRAEMRRG